MATTSIPDKNIRKVIERFAVEVSRTKRHLRLRNPLTGKSVIAPISGSDRRGIRNLERDLKHLCAVATNAVRQMPQAR